MDRSGLQVGWACLLSSRAASDHTRQSFVFCWLRFREKVCISALLLARVAGAFAEHYNAEKLFGGFQPSLWDGLGWLVAAGALFFFFSLPDCWALPLLFACLN